MNDAVADVIAEREGLDRGFPRGLLLSSAFHGVLVGAALLAAWLGATPPKLKVNDGLIVPVQRGGAGSTEVAAGVPTPVKSQPPTTQPEAPPQPEPPKVVKPPKEEPPKKALPDPDAKKAAKKPTPAPVRQAAAPSRAQPQQGPPGARGSAQTTNATPGLGLNLPVGPGVPGGGAEGDWYLTAVQRKIWVVWMQQMKVGFVRPVHLSFTILSDGSLDDGSVRILESSGATLVDMAAKRAIYSGAPFSPLPKHYGTSRLTIQAHFEPTQ
jgi:periplasmic protein TonB